VDAENQTKIYPEFMSFDKVEVRVFSGPDQVQVGSNTEPDLIVMNIGPKGDTGATGNTGATGPAGPNSVTSATTSDGTANLSLGDLEVVGGEIYTDGEYSSIYTQGATAHIFTLGSGAEIFTEGELAQIYTTGASAQIYTAGAGATIGTQGANATIYTTGAYATISTAGSAAHIQTSHASAAVKSTNFAAVESGGASLVDGSMQPCLTWSAGGRNLTIPSGTATTFNATSYTYGSGAAAAHRTALGLDTLFNGKANLAGGNTFTGAQTIAGASLTLQNAGAVTLALNDTSNANIPAFNLQQLGTTRGRIEGGVGLTSRLDFSVGIPLSRTMSLNQGGTQNYGVTIGRSSVAGNVAPPTDGLHVQGTVAIGTTAPSAKAILDLTSTTKGFLPPRMTTTERNAITSVPAGLVIYNTTTSNLNTYNGSAWVELVDSADLGTGIPTFLADPSSENLANALGDTIGTGPFILQDAATLTGPNLEDPIINGSAAFTSTTRPTSAGTGTPAATSLITRDDMSSLFQTFRLLRNFTEVKLMAVAFQGGSGSAMISPSGTNWTQQRYATGAVIGSFAGANSLGSSNFSHPCPLAGTGATAINWGVRQRIFWKFSARTFTGCDYRLYWGGSQNTIGTGDSIVRCVGIKITGTSLFLQAHNGTTMTTSPSLLTVTSDIVYDMWIDCDGLGNASLWNSDTLLGTISGLATNNQTFNACFIDRVDNNATTSSAILSVYNRAILTGSLY
jgi:hypothetical protein